MTFTNNHKQMILEPLGQTSPALATPINLEARSLEGTPVNDGAVKSTDSIGGNEAAQNENNNRFDCK
jgi:hypothetical protein